MSCRYEWNNPKLVALFDEVARNVFAKQALGDTERRRKLVNEIHDLIAYRKPFTDSVQKELLTKRSNISLDYLHSDHWGVTWPGVMLGGCALIYKRLSGAQDGIVRRIDKPHFYVFPGQRIGNVPNPVSFISALALDLAKDPQDERPAATMFSMRYKNAFWRFHDFTQDHAIAMGILTKVILCNLDTDKDLFGMLPLEKIAADLADGPYNEGQKAAALGMVRSLREGIESVGCAPRKLVEGARYFEDLIIPASLSI